MKRWIQWALILLLVGGTAVGIWTIVSFKVSAKKQPPPKVVLHLKVKKLQWETVREVVSSLGTVVPRRRARVVSEVSGVVTFRSPQLEPGRWVDDTTVLVRVAPQKFRWNWEKAKAALAQAKVGLEKLKVQKEDFQIFRKIYRENLSLSQQQEREAELLYQREASSKYEWDKAKRLVRQDLFNLANIEHSLRLLPIQEKELRHLIQLREREVLLAKRLYNKCQVKSPFPGWVVKRSVEVGESTAPGKFFFEVISRERVAQVDLPLHQALKVRTGMTVTLTSPTVKGKWTSKVERIHPELDLQTRTVTIYIPIPPQAKALRAGAFVRAEILLRIHQKAISIPRALLRSDGRVCLLRKGKVVAVPVEVGAFLGEQVWIRKGLKAGDLLILSQIEENWIGLPAIASP